MLADNRGGATAMNPWYNFATHIYEIVIDHRPARTRKGEEATDER
jgi:hypothetical protein